MTLVDDWLGFSKREYEYHSYETGYQYQKETRQRFYGQESWYFVLWFI